MSLPYRAAAPEKPVFDRPFFNLAVINAPLNQLVQMLASLPLRAIEPRVAALAFPEQPYEEADTSPMIFWAPSCEPHHTAFMPGVSSGDYWVMAYATERFGYEAIEVRSTTNEDPWPINELAVYEAGKRRRFVRTMRESTKWDFYTAGTPLPYENQAAYQARRIRDRFSRETLLDCIERWGAGIRDPLFWTSDQPAITFVRKDPAA